MFYSLKRRINRNDWISTIQTELLQEKLSSATCPYLRPSLNITLFQFKWDRLIMFLSSLFWGFSPIFPVLVLTRNLMAVIARSRLYQCCQWTSLSHDKKLGSAVLTKGRKYSKPHKLILKMLDIQSVRAILHPFSSINIRDTTPEQNQCSVDSAFYNF